MGRTNVEDALLRLDSLTKEEGLMTAARNLEVTHRVANIVRDVDVGVKATNSLAEVISENVKVTNALTKDISSDVKKVTKALTKEVGDSVKVIEGMSRNVADNVKATIHRTQPLLHPFSTYQHFSPVACYHSSRRDQKFVPPSRCYRAISRLTMLTGNQAKERVRTWLSPPDPSTNHNHARETQQRGTARWFLQGSTFCEWKKNGSILWIRGNRAPFSSVLPYDC